MARSRSVPILALCVLFAACDTDRSNTGVTSPQGPARFDFGTGGSGLSTTPTFDETILLAEDVAAQEAATGGRASGHVEHSTPQLGIAAEKYSFTALSTDPTPTAKGQVEVKAQTTAGGEFAVHGEVTCLTIVGNQAWIGARATRATSGGNPIPTENLRLVWRVTDNGEGGKALMPDNGSLMFFGGPGLDLVNCNSRLLLPGTSTKANVQVSP